MLPNNNYSGYPIRARKRKAVVKHMFHTPEDVEWFKPAELCTKQGLIGHIKGMYECTCFFYYLFYYTTHHHPFPDINSLFKSLLEHMDSSK